MDSPAETEGRVLGRGKMGLQSVSQTWFHVEALSARPEEGESLMAAWRQAGLEAACRTDQGRERQGDNYMEWGLTSEVMVTMGVEGSAETRPMSKKDQHQLTLNGKAKRGCEVKTHGVAGWSTCYILSRRSLREGSGEGWVGHEELVSILSFKWCQDNWMDTSRRCLQCSPGAGGQGETG